VEFLICRHCGVRIGVYEPTIIEADGQVRETSRAAEPDLPSTGTHYHRDCHMAATQGGLDDGQV
jgi:hypothetical protein